MKFRIYFRKKVMKFRVYINPALSFRLRCKVGILRFAKL